METNLRIVRVQDIILDEEHPEWERCGKHEAIGSILYTNMDIPTPVDGDNSQLPFARPAFYAITQYPLKNEIVNIIGAPNNEYDGGTIPYYLPPLGIQNHPLHNALPTQLSTDVPTLSNEEIQGGATVSKEIEVGLPLGNYFRELEYIRPLRPYEGDVLIEGRYGNSIRLGATTYNQLPNNNRWSSEGEVGNPITIIRNGQIGNETEASFEHIIEDIDGDDSSIYLCSQQQLTNFSPASFYQLSFGKDINQDSAEEPERKNQGVPTNVTEDKIMSSPEKDIPEELLEDKPVEEEETAYYDISGTEGDNILFPGDDIDLPDSYEIPPGANVNDIMGDLNISDNPSVSDQTDLEQYTP